MLEGLKMHVSQAATGRGWGWPPNVRGRGHGGRSPQNQTRCNKESPNDKRWFSNTPIKESKDEVSISDSLEKGSTKKPKVDNQRQKIALPLEVLVTYWVLTKNSKQISLQNYQQKHKENIAEIDSFGNSTTGGQYYCQQDKADTVVYTIERLYEVLLKLDFLPESVVKILECQKKNGQLTWLWTMK